MFERFTLRARRVIVLAQDAAREMGHPQIKPEHLLVGLREGEGLAADALTQGGVDKDSLRERVAALYPSKPAAENSRKVPFSSEGKKSLEQSLRAALALGHNYIGTEHLFFGVERQSEGAPEGRSLDDVLGVSTTEIHRRLTEALSGVTSAPATRSPALQSALSRARTSAGTSPMTTGDVLAGILIDTDSQAARALAEIGVDAQRVQAAIDAVDLADTSDASPPAQSIALTIGETTTVIADPDIAAALQRLSEQQLREALRKAVEASGPDRATG